MNSNEVMIKKIINEVYHLDYSRVKIDSGEEFIINKNGYSDFVQSFKMVNRDLGYIVLPCNYHNGLFYKNEEIFASPRYEPEITKFSFNILGLRVGKFYRITVKSKSTGNYTMFTKDRSLLVTTSTNELLIEEDLSEIMNYSAYSGIFCAQSTEIILNFAIGKIYIKDIVIEEVEIIEQMQELDDKPLEEFTSHTLELCAYGIFELNPGKITELIRCIKLQDISSHGLSLFFDPKSKEYIIERDNANDTVNDTITNIRYSLRIDLSKTISYKKFNGYSITDISPNSSPNTVKQGYYKFVLNGINGEPYVPESSGRIGIYLYKLN